jgi:hypothetical protein
LLGAGSGDSAHCVYHRAELADAINAHADVYEVIGHGVPAFRDGAARATV